MTAKPPKLSMQEQLQKALAFIGGEPLDGSSFEDERPLNDFSDLDLPAPDAPAESGAYTALRKPAP